MIPDLQNWDRQQNQGAENLAESVKLKIPASTSNLGSGFDTFGMALNMYLTVELSLADRLKISYNGDGEKIVALDDTNLVYKTAAKVYKKAGIDLPPLAIHIENPIPLCRGLGSSGAAIIAGIAGANKLLDDKFSNPELLNIANKIEGHPENVAASLYGGLTINCINNGDVISKKVEITNPLKAVLLIPDATVSTEDAREVLPILVAYEEAIFNVQRSALLTHALLTGDYGYLRTAMQDKLHQPFRKQLLPGYDEFEDIAYANAALGVCISGSGSTLLCFTDDKEILLQEKWRALAEEKEISGRVICAEIDNNGVSFQN